MTTLCNDPSEFAAEAASGFCAAHADRVRQVPGGVVRRPRPHVGKVSVVIGGGSGHYPVFAGLVGPGLADGAALGNVFASPSAQQVHDVARASERGAGVLLCYGNYMGDVLNFDQAQSRLIQEGIPARTVRVTDDVSSAPHAERHQRRGVAGGLIVYKIAGAAAEEGGDLDEVERVAAAANERTRSLGVAFGGCTLPGASEPLFTVEAGTMAVGMGIHGEPGISSRLIPSADELAELLVEGVLAEAPEAASADHNAGVAVVLNGLGSVKHEELFVVYRRVAQLLETAGLTPIRPEVGEFATSFDMAGVSLSLCWLDAELRRLWEAPADSPAFRRGVIAQQPAADLDDELAEGSAESATIPAADADSRRMAALVAEGFVVVLRTVEHHSEELGRIDAVAGDGDHGIGMLRGARAAEAAARQLLARGSGASTLLSGAAAAWADKAGGTSGVLWGAFLSAIAAHLSDIGFPDSEDLAAGISAGTQALLAFGAAPGDKTMIDAVVPFQTALNEQLESGRDLASALAAAAAAAALGAERTAGLQARIGRARSHGSNAVGTRDAGAVSFALIAEALAASCADGSLGLMD